MLQSKTVTISVERDWRELYEAFWRPEAFPLWAAGLSSSALVRDGERWRSDGPQGPIRILFSAHNGFGVMDHWVDVGGGRSIYVPLRVVENGTGADVMLTLFRQPEMTDQQFRDDEALVRRDLSALRTLALTDETR